jgi:drug/metabolite transporter (DMT)-like permease
MLGVGLMSPTSIGFWRTFFGAVFLFIIAFVRNRSYRINKSIIGWTALAGFLFSTDLFFWHRSIIYSGAGIATILANTQVFGTAVLSFFIFREKLTIKFLVAAVGAFAGVALLIGIGSEIEMSGRYLRGVIYGLITGVAYANYLVTLKYAGHKQTLPDFVTLMAWVSLFMALFLGSATVIEKSGFFPPDLYAFFILILLGLVPQTIGWWSISSGLSKVNASQAGLILLLQPVLATVWGIMIFAENLSLMQTFGAIVTLLAIYIGSTTREKQTTPVAG